MKNLIFLVSGGGGTLKFIKKCIEKEILKDFCISAVIADRECGALKFAKENGLKNFKIAYNKENNIELKEVLNNNKPVDFIITNIHKIIDEELVNKYEGKLINLHYSLLPAFIGFNSVERALNKDCKFIGTTVHYVDKEVDHGKILSQTVIPVKKNVEFDLLMNKVFQAGCLNLLNTIIRLTHMETIYQIHRYNEIIFSPELVIDTKYFNTKFWEKIKTT